MTTDVFLTFLVTLALYCLIGVVRARLDARLRLSPASSSASPRRPSSAPCRCWRRSPSPRWCASARGDRFFRVLLQGRAGGGVHRARLRRRPAVRVPRLHQLLPRHRGAEPHGAPGRPAAVHQPVHRRAEVRLRPRASWCCGAWRRRSAWSPCGPPASRIVGAVRERSATDFVLLAWVVPFFLITGWFDVKFVRYLLPIYPIMILWAAAWLWRIAQRSRLGRGRAVDGGRRDRPLAPSPSCRSTRARTRS